MGMRRSLVSGGVNLIDSAPAYDFVPGTTASVPEAPLTAGLLASGAVALGSAAIGRRRRRRLDIT